MRMQNQAHHCGFAGRMLWSCSLPSDGTSAGGGNGNAEQHEQDAERRRQEAGPHMHELPSR